MADMRYDNRKYNSSNNVEVLAVGGDADVGHMFKYSKPE